MKVPEEVILELRTEKWIERILNRGLTCTKA